MSILFARLMPLFLLSTFITGPSWADSPINTLLTAKQIGITATVPKLNKASGLWEAFVTLRNKTKLKLKQNFYGPLTMIVTPVAGADIELTNKNGLMGAGQPYLEVPVAAEGLASGRTINRIGALPFPVEISLA